MLKEKPKYTLENIPKDVTEGPFAPFIGDDLHVYQSLSLTSHWLNNLFHQPFKLTLKHIFKELLEAIVDDNPKKVIKILDKTPWLLLVTPKNLVIESQLTGQKFYVEEALKTPLRRRQLEMVKLILPYFDNIKDINGKEEAIKQWDACTVSEKVKKEREQQYANKMKKLIGQIATEKFPKGTKKDRLIDRISDETKKILEDFRKGLLPNTPPIQLDTYFDVELLLHAAYKAYDDNYYVFRDWDQRNLYCIAVIGFIQSVLPPELAKVFCEGLYAVVENKKTIRKDARSFELTNDEGFSIYRSKSDTASGVDSGFDFFVSTGASASTYPEAPSFSHSPFSSAHPGSLLLKNYIEQKQWSWARLKANLRQGIYSNMSPRRNVFL